MKYQSEIIKEIIASKGHLKSLPHYESECVETWIEEAKGAYPKITDYEGEWLDYINDNNGIGEFPYVSLTGVTEATIENVVPYAYKSAILKGQTLVNLCDKTKNIFSSTGNKNLWQNALSNTNPTQLTIINYTDKVIKYSVNNRTTDAWVSTNKVNPNSKLLVNCGTDNYLKDLYGAYGDGWSNTKEDINILKDGVLILEGDYTNVDIPYFEGMQSVKMPVLTTSNEDGTKTNILTVNEDVELRGIGDVKDELNCLTGEVTERIGEIVLDEDITGYQDTNNSVNGYSAFRVTSITNIPNGLSNVICDKVKYYPNINLEWTKQEEFFTTNGNLLFVKILSTKASNFEELRTFLSSSPITIQYELAESIKTVDLTVTDQDGNTKSNIRPIEGTMHVSTASQTFPPSLDMSVPVEATSQNLMSFANIEEEEK